MRRTVLLLAGVLLSAVALGSDSPKEYDDKTVNGGIDGTWRLVERHGSEIGPDVQYVFHAGTCTSKLNGHDTWKMVYRIDTTRKPFRLDWTPSSDLFLVEPSKDIFQIDGDRLMVAYLPADCHLRPQGFSETGVGILTFKRVK